MSTASTSPRGTLGEQAPPNLVETTVFPVLFAISFCHLLNDMVQSLIVAIYPMLKASYHLDFSQVGLISLTYQSTASLLQPAVGLYTDYRPRPYSLSLGMGCTWLGLLSVSRAHSFPMLLVSVALVGMGSAVFHPESSRVARMASGTQHGLAQSIFQVGGNAGASVGPLLAAFLVAPRGQGSVAWLSLATFLAIVVLTWVGGWYQRNHRALPRPHPSGRAASHAIHAALSRCQITLALAVLLALIFSKYFYLSSIGSYYTFYLIGKFHLSVQSAQIHLFLFLGAAAAGTFAGGPIGDRIGRKYVIWGSILGVLPFTLLLPYANLFWTSILTVVIGLVIASAFSAILVYAHELFPGRVGMISGLFFGLAFGMSGVGAAVLGRLADRTSIGFVYHVCSFLPAIGILAAWLPNLERRQPVVA